MSRSRLNLYLQPGHAKRLGELATMRGLSKSSIVAAALASFLSPDGADQREAVIARRLDRHTHQFDLLERDQTILIEAVALFIRHYLTVSTPVPPGHQEAVRAQGRARFEQFVEQLGRHLHRGHSLARRLTEQVGADGREYAQATDDATQAIGESAS
ncbi:MAG: CopG family transcriptional regulator [Steroidobacteraceae bacterium]